MTRATIWECDLGHVQQPCTNMACCATHACLHDELLLAIVQHTRPSRPMCLSAQTSKGNLHHTDERGLHKDNTACASLAKTGCCPPNCLQHTLKSSMGLGPLRHTHSPVSRMMAGSCHPTPRSSSDCTGSLPFRRACAADPPSPAPGAWYGLQRPKRRGVEKRADVLCVHQCRAPGALH
jgi:hypothetical protein